MSWFPLLSFVYLHSTIFYRCLFIRGHSETTNTYISHGHSGIGIGLTTFLITETALVLWLIEVLKSVTNMVGMAIDNRKNNESETY